MKKCFFIGMSELLDAQVIDRLLMSVKQSSRQKILLSFGFSIEKLMRTTPLVYALPLG